MTTIVFDGKDIFADSQITCGNMKCGNMNKIVQLIDGSFFASTGSIEDAELVINWLNAGGDGEKPKIDEDRFSCIVFNKDKGEYFTMYGKLVACKEPLPIFLGSGAEIAAGAYYSTDCAHSAMNAACELDTRSSKPIYTTELYPEVLPF